MGVFCLAGCSQKSEVPNKEVSTVEGAESSGGSGSSSANGSTAGSSTASTSASAAGATVGGGSNIAAVLFDSGGADSNAFNQEIWSGMKSFVKSHTEWKAKATEFAGDADTAQHSSALQSAVDSGAKMIVCVGSTYSTLLPAAADANPDVSFLLVDAEMTDTAGAAVSKNNVHCVTFDNAQAGYLAGYALVKEGYRGLGFAGGKAVPSVMLYGSGFVQGANAAAEADGVAADTYLAYWYTDTFAASEAVQTEVQRWYGNGVDVVFSCGGSISENVIAAAAATSKTCAMADADGSKLSSTVVCSATKNLSGGISDALGAFTKNNSSWDQDMAGKTSKLGLADDGVSLTCGSTWKLTKFSESDYKALVDKIKSGEIVVNEDANATLNVAIQVDRK